MEQGATERPVQPLYLPQAANGQLAQLVADLQARSCLYDVIDMDVVWTAQFASSGWIIPLKGFSTSGFLAPAVDTARYEGQLYAVPDYTNADLLYYRTDLVKKPPATWGSSPPTRSGCAGKTTWTATPPRSRRMRASRSTSPRPSSRKAAPSSPGTGRRSP